MGVIKKLFMFYLLGLVITFSLVGFLFLIDWFFGGVRIYAKTGDIIVSCLKSSFFFGFSAYAIHQAFKD